MVDQKSRFSKDSINHSVPLNSQFREGTGGEERQGRRVRITGHGSCGT